MNLGGLENKEHSNQHQKGACEIKRTSIQGQNNLTVSDATQTVPAAERVDILPDGGYGWVSSFVLQ